MSISQISARVVVWHLQVRLVHGSRQKNTWCIVLRHLKGQAVRDGYHRQVAMVIEQTGNYRIFICSNLHGVSVFTRGISRCVFEAHRLIIATCQV